MRAPFLEILARFLVKEDPDEMESMCILLPNRRSGLFLRHHLSSLVQENRWMPEVFSMGEFIEHLSPLAPCSSLDAVLGLYKLYGKMRPNPEGIDEFFHWGEMMLRDFDELDKYLVDPDQLFRNLSDLKELEDPLAGMDQAQLAFIRQFWEGFQAGADSPEKQKFLQIWDLLPRLYALLRQDLLEDGAGYPGMLYRELCESIARGNEQKLPWKRILVVGFNALNAAEIQIFHWLKRRGAWFFWDYDHSYLDDSLQEAGRFLRDNLRRFPPRVHLDHFRREGHPGLRIFELPTDILQAKTAHRILEESAAVREDSCTDTAVVLCDEELLMPVLLSLPSSPEETNITMGYPLASTSLAAFLNALFRLQHNARTSSDGRLSFYHRDVRSLLMHPYTDGGAAKGAHPLLEQMTRQNLVRIEATLFAGELERLIFQKPGTQAELFAYLKQIFAHLMAREEAEEKGMEQLQGEFMARFLGELHVLESSLTDGPEFPVELLQNLLRRMVRTLRVPFEGEPLSGLQLMGILETRLLDFRHVVLLSMNEEIMPAGSDAQSYIPYALRRAFGMPGKEEKEAIYAYYFYRLLQRADQVDLLYNSSTEGMRSGEMSRYLQQLVFSRGIRPIQPGMEVKARPRPVLEVPHDTFVDERLKSYLGSGSEQSYLSPSAINAYVSCSLKFYFRYLAGIGEVDQVSEEMDPSGFGTVVHESMKVLYGELGKEGGEWIRKEALQKLLASPRLREVLQEEFLREQKGKGSIEGRNLIILEVMERYLKHIIRHDLKLVPFRMVSAENKYLRSLPLRWGKDQVQVWLGGKIDRVDEVDGRLRVIDYKTGKAKTSFGSLEELFDGGRESRNGAALQTLLYAWLLGESHPGEPIAPGLYVMQDLLEDDSDPLLRWGPPQGKTPIRDFAELESEYLGLLTEKLEELFNPAHPFVQTTNEKLCRHCDYAPICGKSRFD